MGSDSISKLLSVIFRNCLKAGYLSATSSKKANVIPVHKKGNKHILSNYRPAPLLPICGKLFGKIIFDTTFQHLMENDLINPNKSVFTPGDSCIHQFISITDEICPYFDSNPSLEVRGVFLDVSKTFERV